MTSEGRRNLVFLGALPRPVEFLTDSPVIILAPEEMATLKIPIRRPLYDVRRKSRIEDELDTATVEVAKAVRGGFGRGCPRTHVRHRWRVITLRGGSLRIGKYSDENATNQQK